MKINRPLCIFPSYDDHRIKELKDRVNILKEIQDDGRLVPKLEKIEDGTEIQTLAGRSEGYHSLSEPRSCASQNPSRLPENPSRRPAICSAFSRPISDVDFREKADIQVDQTASSATFRDDQARIRDAGTRLPEPRTPGRKP